MEYPKSWNKKNRRRFLSGRATVVADDLMSEIEKRQARVRRQRELERISEKRYLTDAEIKELRKLDYLIALDGGDFEKFLADWKEESEKYDQYVHEVPEWAKN